MAGKLTLDAIKAQLEGKAKSGSGSGDGGGDKFYFPPKDTTQVTLRILPPWEGANMIGKIIYKHYNIPGDNSATCFKTHGLDCPICNLLEEYQQKINVDDYKAAGRAWVNALVLNDPTQNPPVNPREPKIMGLTTTVFYKIIEDLGNPEIGLDVVDLRNGNNFILQREKAGGKFIHKWALKSTPAANTEDDLKLIDTRIHNIDKIWRAPDDEYFKKVLVFVEEMRKMFEKKMTLADTVGTSGLPQVPTTPAAQPQTSPGAPQPSPTTSATPAASAASVSPTPVAPSQTSGVAGYKPPGSPNCFGDKQVFNESNSTCIMCPYDMQCKDEIGKRG